MPGQSVTVMAASAAVFAATPAVAADEAWFGHLGIATTDLQDKSRIRRNGEPLAGAAIRTDVSNVPNIEIGRRITPHVAIAIAAGVPPKTQVEGRGTLSNLGRIATITAGVGSLTAQWRPIRGRLEPYVGAGIAYLHTFKVRDGALKGSRASNDFGPVAQIGVELQLIEGAGIYAELRQTRLKSTLRGTIGGASIVGVSSPDPLIIDAGALIRF